MCTQSIIERRAKLPPGEPETWMAEQDVWVGVRNLDGNLFYHNFKLNGSKWADDMTEIELADSLPEVNPYDNPDMYLTLEEFVSSEAAAEHIYNGQVYQVLGLTSYSRWGHAAALRQCSRDRRDIAEKLLDLAVQRLR